MHKLRIIIGVLIVVALLTACQSKKKETTPSTTSINIESNILGLAGKNSIWLASTVSCSYYGSDLSLNHG